MNKKDSNFAMFIIGTIVVGVIIFAAVFFTVFRTFKAKPVEVNEGLDLSGAALEETKVVILDIDHKNKTMVGYDFEKKAVDKEFNMVSTTKYIDSNSMLLSPSEVSTGDVADIVYSGKNKAITSFKLDPDVWVKKDIDNIKFDYADRKIIIDKKIYKFNDNLVVEYKGEDAEYEDISENVILNLKGYENEVWYIDIKEYLGNIRLIYEDILEGADVEIDNDKFVKIKEVEDTYLAPGEHKLVIKKSEIDPIVFNVEVVENDVVEIDLGEVSTKKSKVNFNANVTDYYVDIRRNDGTINKTYTDSLEDSSTQDKIYYNQLELPYGEYVMTFRKKGFKTITKDLTISKPITNFNIKLLSDGTTMKVSIESTPKDAEVYLNGKLQGVTPIDIFAYQGKNVIKVEKTGYVSKTLEKDIEGDSTFKFELTKENIYDVEDEEDDENEEVKNDIYVKE